MIAGNGSAALLDRPRLRRPSGTSTSVLSAPAGFGKTALASQWTRAVGTPVAWVSLQADDDGRAVAQRIFEAARALGADLRPPAAGLSPSDRIDRRLLHRVSSQLARVGPAVLVLDALDAPTRTSLVEDLQTWIATVPVGVHLIVTRRSRWDPSVDRAGGPVTVLDRDDLAFTIDETAQLVRRVAGIELDHHHLEAIADRSQGWPVAVHGVASALCGSVEPGPVIEGLNGANPHVAAFLDAEVLSQVPRDVQRFLVRTSVLETLNSSLCATVARDPRAGTMLRRLDRSGLLAATPSAGGGGYTCPPLVRDFLRRRLRATEPELETALLQRALEWHVAHDRTDDAIRDATELEDWDRVLAIVDHVATPACERGDGDRLLQVVEAVPNPHRTDLGLRRAFLLSVTGQTSRAAEVLRGVEADDSPRGEIAAASALRATWAFCDASPQSSIRAAELALETLRTTPPAELPAVLGMTSHDDLEAMSLASRGRARWYLTELESSREDLEAAGRVPGAQTAWRLHAGSSLALLEAWAGNLYAALAHGRHVILLAKRAGLGHHPGTFGAQLALAHVLRERGELRRSNQLLTGVLADHQWVRRPVTLAIHTVERALWDLAAGELPRGTAEIHRFRAAGEPPPPPIVSDALCAAEVQLLLAQHQVARAEAVLGARRMRLDGPLAAAAVQVAVVGDDPAEARHRLDDWVVGPTDIRERLQREMWTAVLDLQDGKALVAAKRMRERVLPEAERQGFRRLFLDAGPVGTRLLRSVVRAAPTSYATEVLRSAGAALVAGDGTAAGFSAREREVIRYLPTSLSSAEIASQLYISVNTLRSHQRALYRKLGVNSRREAARRAQELGIA